MTYTALAVLITLGDSLDRANKESVSKGLAALQREDGSFQAMPSDDDTGALSYHGSTRSSDGRDSPDSNCLEADTRFVYAACCVASLLKDWRGVNTTACKRYLRSCLAPLGDGGFALTPGQEAHGGSTFTATAALALLGEKLSAEQPTSLVTPLRAGASPDNPSPTTHNNSDNDSISCTSSNGDKHNNSVLATWEREDLVAWCLRRQVNPASRSPNFTRVDAHNSSFGANASSDTQGKKALETAGAAAVGTCSGGDGCSGSKSSNSVSSSCSSGGSDGDGFGAQGFQPPGGFTGRVNKAPDTCYSFWVGGTLALLGEFGLVHCER